MGSLRPQIPQPGALRDSRPQLAYSGQRPSPSSRRQRTFARAHSASVALTATHSFFGVPPRARPLGRNAYCSQTPRSSWRYGRPTCQLGRVAACGSSHAAARSGSATLLSTRPLPWSTLVTMPRLGWSRAQRGPQRARRPGLQPLPMAWPILVVVPHPPEHRDRLLAAPGDDEGGDTARKVLRHQVEEVLLLGALTDPSPAQGERARAGMSARLRPARRPAPAA